MQFFPAPADLAGQVLGVVIHRASPSGAVCVPAHALAIASFVLRGSLRGQSGSLNAGAAVLGGSASQGVVLQGSADLLSLGLLCRASVLPLLSGEPAHVFADRMLPAADLWGAAPVAHWQALADSGARDARLAAELLAWARLRLRRARVQRPAARRFAQALRAWPRDASGRLVTGVPEGWSERHWQRACQEELGVRPMQLLRLDRLHASVRTRDATGGDWALHALEAGYSDQPHLSREYRALAGLTPLRATDAPGLALGAWQLAPRFFGG